MSSCSGCFPNYQYNQFAHMESGGCMYVDDYENEELFCQPVNLEAQFDAVADSESASIGSGFESASTGTECCICYEIIGKKNNCVTECGHVFCLKCLATSLTHNSSCPCCRAPLVDTPEENEDDDSDYVSEDDDDYEDDEDEEIEITVNKTYNGDIEDIVSRMEKSGITMLDVVSLLLSKFSKTDEKYTDDYVRAICDTVDQINIDSENESIERSTMGGEDKPQIATGEPDGAILARLGPLNETA